MNSEQITEAKAAEGTLSFQPEIQPQIQSPLASASMKSLVVLSDADLQEVKKEFAATSVLSYEQLRSVGNWNQVKTLYSQVGVSRSTDNEYLEMIGADWKSIVEQLTVEALVTPFPTQLPARVITLDGAEIRLVGILHSDGIHPEAQVLLREFARCTPWLLTEQNLGVSGGGRFSQGTDIPDHYARGIVYASFRGVLKYLSSAFQYVKNRYGASPQINEMLGQDLYSNLSADGEEAARRQAAKGQRDPVAALGSALYFHCPGDIANKLPTNVELAYKDYKAVKYSDNEARSAYMAEFLRHVDMLTLMLGEQVDSSSLAAFAKKSPEYFPKDFLCGKAHEEQIVYFLQNGCRDPKVVARAKRDAQILNEGGEEALAKILDRRSLCDSVLRASLICYPALAASIGVFEAIKFLLR